MRTCSSLSLLLILCLTACGQSSSSKSGNLSDTNNMTDNNLAKNSSQLDTATFGAGCFWCIEAIFQSLEGVEKVSPGYTGGNIPDPTYEEVCTGTSGHAEVAQIVFDPSVISFSELLEVFWKTHDPTTLNRQGADVGTQYRSAIFYHNDEQMRLAAAYKTKLNEAGAFSAPIVTEITPLSDFYLAENYHEDYYRNNPDKAYCRLVIKPKLEKFEKVFKDKLKEKQ